jgi:hypothetical protein
MSVFSNGPGNGIYTKSSTNVLGLGATVDANGAFVASTGPVIRFSGANPSGVVTANAGSLSLSDGSAYIGKGGTVWNSVTAVPAGSKGGYQFYAMTTQTANVGDNTSGVLNEIPFTSTAYAANSLSAGSTIRVRLAGVFQVAGAAPGTTLLIRFDLGPSFVGSVLTGAIAGGLSSPVILDVQFTTLTAGSGGTCTSSLQGSYTAIALGSVNTSAAVDTTISNTLRCFVQFNNAAAGTNFDILQYNVDFYQ